jgi:hypothetical protein
VSVERIRFIAAGALFGVTWAAGLRGFMMVLAGLDSSFTFRGTFGVILPTGLVVGALLGAAEYDRRTGRWHAAFLATPLLLGVLPVFVLGDGGTPLTLALTGMVGGYAMSGRGPRWARAIALALTAAAVVTVFAAPKPGLDLGLTTPKGAWFDVLAASLYLTFALACSIPMRRPLAVSAARPEVAAVEEVFHPELRDT